MAKRKKQGSQDDPIGIDEIDRIDSAATVTLDDYIVAVSAYVLKHRTVPKGRKKAAQIRLSGFLARALQAELVGRIPTLTNLKVQETKVAGGLRTVNADVSQSHALDGLRLAVEIKPVNLAVGRAIWNRFGDLRAFAVNIHLKFPFCVVGGVLVIPCVEEVGTSESQEAEKLEEVLSTEEPADAIQVLNDAPAPPKTDSPAGPTYKDTKHLIALAIRRLIRARGRKTEADAAHQLEAIAVIVYDPRTSKLDSSLPAPSSKLTWDDFVDDIVSNYESRFE